MIPSAFICIGIWNGYKLGRAILQWVEGTHTHTQPIYYTSVIVVVSNIIFFCEYNCDARNINRAFVFHILPTQTQRGKTENCVYTTYIYGKSWRFRFLLFDGEMINCFLRTFVFAANTSFYIYELYIFHCAHVLWCV